MSRIDLHDASAEEFRLVGLERLELESRRSGDGTVQSALLRDVRAWLFDRTVEMPGSLGFNAIRLEVRGNGIERLLNEAGGHRIQRIPPTERRGRVHTSTVTVAVMGIGAVDVDSSLLKRAESDFRIEWFSGSGAGGSTETAISIVREFGISRQA